MDTLQSERGPRGRREAIRLGLTLAAGIFSGSSFAQSIAKVCKIVIPYSPGGSTDIVGRIFATAASQHMGITFVPENRGGAAGMIGMQEVVRSKPDGLTLGISGIGTTSLIALTQKKPPYVFERDLDVVGHLGAFGSLVVTKPGAPYKTLSELVVHAKNNPGVLAFGTPPSGSPSHLTLEYLKDVAGIKMLDVPYKGHTEILNGVLSGEINLGIVSVPQAHELVRNKKLVALAVTSAKRSSTFPEVPTVAEQGYPGFDATLWNLLVCRKGADKEWLSKLNQAVNAIFTKPEVQKQLHTQSIEFEPLSIAETQAFVVKEQEKWAHIAAKVKLKPA